MKNYLKIIRRLPRLARVGLLVTAANGGGKSTLILWALVAIMFGSFALDTAFDLLSEKAA